MNPKDLAEYTAFRGLVGGLQAMPGAAARRALLSLGRLAMKWPPGRPALVRRQLAAAFPQEDAARLDYRMELIYNHLALTAWEIFCADRQALMDAARVDPGWDILDSALAAGKGAILASGHLGNFELGGAFIARRHALLDVVKTQRNRRFDAYLDGMRRAGGIQTVPMPHSAGPILRHLRAGGLVSLLLDQDAGAQGVVIDFLGRPASTWPGAARLSLRTGCPVVPTAMIREDNGRHCLRLGPILWPREYEDTPAGVSSYLQKISSSFEAFVLEHPEQWFWVHRRWKSVKVENRHGAEERQRHPW